MSPFALSQILVAIAFCFDCASFQFKGRRAILACFVASTVFISIHFFVLDNLSAGALVLVSMTRFCVAYFSKRKFWTWIFCAIATVTLALTYKQPLNLLPYIASIIASISSFQENDKRMRIGFMFGTSFWVVHNILAGTPAAVILEAVFLLSNFIGYWRFYVRPNAVQSLAVAP